MFGKVITLALCLLVATATAAEPAILDTSGVADGKYYYEIVIANGEVTSLRPLTKVLRLSGNPVPPSDPDPGPDTLPTKVKVLTTTALQSGATPTTALGLASVYSFVGDEVRAGKVPHLSSLQLIKSTTDAVLLTQADGAKWTTWRTEIGNLIALLQQQQKLQTKENYADMLSNISDGLKRAVANTAGVDNYQAALSEINTLIAKRDPNVPSNFLGGIDIAKLMELIRLIMELIKIFQG